MKQVIIMTSDQPASHEQYQLRQGDPVIAMPSTHQWSETERKVFLIVEFEDDALSPDGWEALVEPQAVARVTGGLDPNPTSVQLRARRYRLDLDKVTPERKAEIVATNEEKPVSTGEFTIRDFVDKESLAPRFKKGDTILSGVI